MKRSTIVLVAALLASVTFTAAPAEAATTRITPKAWLVDTSDTVEHRVELGQTFTACASHPVNTIYLKVRVNNAHKGRSFREVWRLDGAKQFADTDTWGRNGDFTDYFGLTDDPSLEDGVWTVKFVKRGHDLAQSRVTLQTDATCRS